MNLRCKNKKCGAKLIIKGGGSLDKVQKIKCSRCGEVNYLDRKKNGKFRVS